MTTAFDEYRQAIADLEGAEARANEQVGAVNTTLYPLLANWKDHYIVGAGDIAANLIRGGKRKAVDVSKLPGIFGTIQLAMTQYVDALERAQKAYSRFTQDERKLVKSPPWMKNQSGQFGGRSRG